MSGEVGQPPAGTGSAVLASWPRWLLLALGHSLLIAAWIFAVPPGATDREGQQLVRAVAVGRGEWQGAPAAPYEAGGSLTVEQARFWNQLTRRFTIPAGLAPVPSCLAGAPDASAACVAGQPNGAGSQPVSATSAVGAYQPFGYLPAGFATRLARDRVGATYLARLGSAALCVLLLATAGLVLAGRAAAWPLAGLALAATPAVVILAAGVSPAGIEVCSGIAFAAALVGLWQGQRPRASAGVLGVAGAVLAISYPPGALYMAALLLVTVPLMTFRALATQGVLLSLPLLALGAATSLAWARGSQTVHSLSPDQLLGSLQHVADRVPALAAQLVDGAGVLDASLPPALAGIWLSLELLLVAAALVLGLWRERLSLLCGAAAAMAVAAGLYGLVLRPAWEIEARYLLPVAGILPLLTGLVLARVHVGPRRDVFLIGLLVGGLQFVVFWLGARRYAVGQLGPLTFVGTVQWSPPGGWLLWLLVAGSGSLLLALALVPLTSRERQILADEERRPVLFVNSSKVSISR